MSRRSWIAVGTVAAVLAFLATQTSSTIPQEAPHAHPQSSMFVREPASPEDARVLDWASATLAQLLAEGCASPATESRSYSSGSTGSETLEAVAWSDEYVDSTRETVVRGAAEAEVLLSGMCDSLVEACCPPRVAGGDATVDLSGYDAVVCAKPNLAGANVFDRYGTPVYFFYIDVVLERGGVLESRTLEIPLAFVSGTWTPSVLSIQSSGLAHVQWVPL